MCQLDTFCLKKPKFLLSMTSSEDEGMLSAGSGNLCPEHGSSAVHSPPTLLFPWLVPSTCSFWDHAMFMSAFSLPGCRPHNEPFTLLIPRPWLNELSLKTAWVVCVRSCPVLKRASLRTRSHLPSHRARPDHLVSNHQHRISWCPLGLWRCLSY